MKNINLFDNNYIDTLCPENNEFLWSIFNHFGYKNDDDPEVKKQTLLALKKMLDLDIIYVDEWIANPELENHNLTTDKIIKHIDKIWFEGAKFPDLYGMVIFGTQKWYTEALEKKGMTNTTNWKLFVKNKIGNLEQWIEDNRPK